MRRRESKFAQVAQSLINVTYDLENASPEFCVDLLESANEKTFSKIQKKISTSNRRWIRDFIRAQGLFALLQCIEKIFKKTKQNSFITSILLFKCLSCIKELMNAKYGMEAIIRMGIEDKDCIQILAKVCYKTNYQLVKKEVFQIFCGIGMYNEMGFSVCIQALDAIKMLSESKQRFSILINELNNNLNQQSVSYLTVIVGFINCLLSQPEELRERLNIRFEFINLKINQIFESLKKLTHDDLIIQIDLFEKFQHEDEIEGHNEYDLTNLNDAFQALCMKNQFSAFNTQKFLELLQLLFHVEEETSKESKKWVNVTNSVREIVFFKDDNTSSNIATQTDPESLPATKTAPPPPPPPGLFSPPAPLKPSSSSKVNVKPLATTPPPPHPPLLPSGPPPPPPFMSSGPPPPPPSFISTGKPIETNTTTQNIDLIYNNIPKPSKPLKNLNWQQLPKGTNNVSNMWKDINQNYNGIEFDFSTLEDLFGKVKRTSNLGASVANPTAKKLSLTNLTKQSNQDPEFTTFLDSKSTMSFSIFLKKTKSFKMEKLVDLVKRGKSKEIGLDNLICLRKILPDKADVEEIQSYCRDNPEMTHLAEPDHFIKLLSDIPSYELRIKLMNYLEEFDDIHKQINSQIQVYLRSSRFILENETLREILSMVLRLGNFLNANSYKGSTTGFKISSLATLQDLKSNKGSVTSMNFLVEQFENNHKQDESVFEFIGVLKELGTALNHGFSNLQTDFNQMKKNVNDFVKRINDSETLDIKSQYSTIYKNFSSKVTKLSEQFEIVDSYTKELIKSYGEDELTFNLDDFLKNFHDFSINMSRSREENKTRIIKEEKASKRKFELTDKHRSSPTPCAKEADNERTGSLGNIVSNEGLAGMLMNLRKGDCKRPSLRRKQPQSDDKKSPEKDSSQTSLNKMNMGFKLPNIGEQVKLRSTAASKPN